MRLCAAFPESSIALIDSLREKLMVRKMLLGTAESCTGGLIAALCTEVPGSSAWFAGGVVAYANAVKTALLGVSPEKLEAHGAVSEAVVLAMAHGGLARLGVDMCLAASGVAGPDGGTAENPVGTVWIGGAVRAGSQVRTAARFCHFPGDRGEIRFATALAALELGCELLE